MQANDVTEFYKQRRKESTVNNTVNTNPEALTEQKLKELRKEMTDLGIKLIDFARRDDLGNVDRLSDVSEICDNIPGHVCYLIAQLYVLDELIRPVGSRGQTLQVNREEFMRS